MDGKITWTGAPIRGPLEHRDRAAPDRPRSGPGRLVRRVQAARPRASRTARGVGRARCTYGPIAVESARSQRKDHVPTWLWIVIIVIVVLVVFGYFGRGRFSR
jgi:hypothetical protein